MPRHHILGRNSIKSLGARDMLSPKDSQQSKPSNINFCCASILVLICSIVAVPLGVMGILSMAMYDKDAPRIEAEKVTYQKLPEALTRFNNHYDEIFANSDPNFAISEVSRKIHDYIYFNCISIRGYFVYTTKLPFKSIRDQFHDYFRSRGWQVTLYNPITWEYHYEYEDIGEMRITIKKVTKHFSSQVTYEINAFYAEPYIGACSG